MTINMIVAGIVVAKTMVASMPMLSLDYSAGGASVKVLTDPSYFGMSVSV